MQLQGAMTAMVTPFRDGKVDYEQLEANVAWQIEQGIDGLVPCGTTGESPTLDYEEHDKVIETVVKAVAGRVPVIAGTGSNSTDEALKITRHAREVGADASLQVNPYYNKPSQEGLYRHFMTIADACDIPLVLYNIPGRTGVTMSADTVARLATHPNIVAVKEATGSLDMATEILSKCEIALLSGDDSLTLPLMAVGGSGVISVATNLIPSRVKALTNAALQGDFATARQHHLSLFELFQTFFIDGNPVSIKAAMQLCGKDSGELRLPLTPTTDANVETIRQALARNGVLEAAGVSV